tara:strand:- start:4543 stop:6489 length:1947 start_codon:yes stop_codon:yes gene_type:complete
MKMIKQAYILLFVLVLMVILLNKEIITKSKINFYVFLLSVTVVISTLYMNTKIIENFEDTTQAQNSSDNSGASSGASSGDSSGDSSGANSGDSSGANSGSVMLVSDIRIEKNFFDEEFRDEFVNKFGSNQLKYYVSTFDKSKIDMDKNLLINHVNLPIAENNLEIPIELKEKLQQSDGLMLNFTKSLKTITPKQLAFNHNAFTIMWYAKFLPIISSSEGIKKKVLFLNIPIHSGKEGKMLAIEYEFQPQFVNPTIRIHWGGKDGSSGDVNDLRDNIYEWSSTTDTNDMNFNFFDNKYHLFTLLRDNTGLKLILDDQDLGLQPLIAISQSELPDSLKTLPDYNDINYKIRLNANVDEPTPTSDNAREREPEIALNCLLNAFAIFNSALTLSQVNVIYDYFEDTKYRLNKRFADIKLKIDEAKNLKDCPFTDKALCRTNNCSSIKDWTNNNEIIKNEACFKDVVAYCKDNKNDTMCSFFDENNILSASSMMNNKTVDNNEISEQLSEEEELVKQLRKFGLNNVHLDKSLRANGKYSNEINELIDKIYKQKQMKMKGIQDLYDADSEVPSIEKLNSEKILKGELPSDKTDDATETETKNKKKARDIQLLKAEDLDYGDFKTDMKRYDAEKNSELKNSESKNKSFVGNIFNF